MAYLKSQGSFAANKTRKKSILVTHELVKIRIAWLMAKKTDLTFF